MASDKTVCASNLCNFMQIWLVMLQQLRIKGTIMTTEVTQIEVFTDGACRGNPGPGGWGALLLLPDRIEELCGGERNTTNNQMELQGAIEALQWIAQQAPTAKVVLHTDSNYVKNGITEWIQGWKQRGWRTAAKQPVKNQQYWQQLDALNQSLAVDWRWIKGHAGHDGNERADQLANRGLDSVFK
jgi:ribonuclease HI